ncbi:MAG TPA: VTT domain-containing protein [Candidatus Competibacter sp.]|nr:VTT domain-containing protein [Candidatus Competibacter sp.]
MSDLIHTSMQWVSLHPHFAGLILGLATCAESLAFIGLVVPGATLTLVAGVLVGAGSMAFRSTFAWAVGGAVLGDGLSYWFGHRYQAQLRDLGVLRRHPEWLARGENFFHRHGGKSILFARFVGPVRPVIPVVAGMLGMAPIRFYLYNFASALIWAAAHLLPGMVFGASLALAGQVATRLAVVLGTLVASAWLIVWLIRLSYRQLQPRVARWATQAMVWGRSHRYLAWLVTDLLDPARPVSRALLIWLLMFIAAGWLFLGILEDVLSQDQIVYAGQALYHLLQQLRTPLGDRIMVVLTELGDAAVTIPVAIVVLVWLLGRRAWRDALYWLTTLGSGTLAVIILKVVLKVPRPVALYSGTDAYSFPSGHATLSTVIYGFLAVLVAGTFSPRWRWTPYASAALLIIGIAFSRLYLGAHWLADVTAGVSLGTVWVALLAIARERHPSAPVSIQGLATVALLGFLCAAGWHVHNRVSQDLVRYAVRHPVMAMPVSVWWQGSWEKLPVWRLDLQGEHEQPLNVQWVGDLGSVRQSLLAQGWQEPTVLSARTALRWFLPKPSLEQLPVLPQLHDGQYESLLLTAKRHDQTHSAEQWILRLWPTMLRLQPNDIPVWMGTVTSQYRSCLPLICFPRSGDGYDSALAALESTLSPERWKQVQRPPGEGEETARWSGTVLLVDSDNSHPFDLIKELSNPSSAQ